MLSNESELRIRFDRLVAATRLWVEGEIDASECWRLMDLKPQELTVWQIRAHRRMTPAQILLLISEVMGWGYASR